MAALAVLFRWSLHDDAHKVQPVEPAGSVLGKVEQSDGVTTTRLAAAAQAKSRYKDGVATRVAHEELGEKMAIFIGGAFALAFEGLSPYSCTKLLMLVLLEAVADTLKEAVYAKSAIDVGRVQLNIRGSTLVAVALIGCSTCCCLLCAIRANCLVGQQLADLLD